MLRHKRSLILWGLVVCGALCSARSSQAQFIGGPARNFGTSYYGVNPGYGYGYGNVYNYNNAYNPGLYPPNSPYAIQMYVTRPQTYNNINGVAGIINQSISNRGTGTYSRRR